jgi:hypothetical protein
MLVSARWKAVEITTYCLGSDGRPVFEKTYDPVLASELAFSRSSEPLKPGYSRQFGVKMDDASVAGTPLRFAITSPASGCEGDLHPRAVEHCSAHKKGACRSRRPLESRLNAH